MSVNRVFVGVDYSMTSPAIAVWDSSTPFTFENIFMYNFYTVKKYEGTHGKHANISIIMQPPHDNNEERFRRIAQWAKAVFLQHKATDAVLEDYALGASGNVYQIGENAGQLKQVFNQLRMPFITPKPTEVKKIWAGKGNAKKDMMVDKFDKIFRVKMQDILDTPKFDSKPIDDIVDSVAILSCHPELLGIKIGHTLEQHQEEQRLSKEG